MLEKKQKSVVIQVKLERNERGVEMMLVNYCDFLKIRYPERHDKINISALTL